MTWDVAQNITTSNNAYISAKQHNVTYTHIQIHLNTHRPMYSNRQPANTEAVTVSFPQRTTTIKLTLH